MAGQGGLGQEEDERDDRREALRAVATVRLIATPLLTVAAVLQPDAHIGWLAALVVIACVHLAATTPPLLRGTAGPRLLLVSRLGDLLLVGLTVALVERSSPTFALVALLAVLLSPSLLQPRASHVLEGVFAAALVVLVLLGGPGRDADVRAGATVAATACLIAVVSGIFGSLERRRLRAMSALAAERRALLSSAAAHAEADRRGVSQELHDGVLQTLLAAGQDLDDAAAGGGEEQDLLRARDLVRTSVEALREAVLEMHPHALTGSSLPPALTALVARHVERGARIAAAIDPDATGPCDEELYAVARELLANATNRPGVGVVRVRLWRDDGLCRLEVVRDGGGARRGARAGDTAVGTVGIAWTAERLRQAGGGLRLDLDPDAPGRGSAWAPASGS